MSSTRSSYLTQMGAGWKTPAFTTPPSWVTTERVGEQAEVELAGVLRHDHALGVQLAERQRDEHGALR